MQLKWRFLLAVICFLGGPAAIVQARMAKAGRPYVEMLVRTDRPDRTYNTGEKAVIVVEALAGGTPLENTWVHYTTGPDMQPADRRDSVQFRNGRAEIPAGTSAQPGFRFCQLDFTVAGQVYRDFLKVAYSPSQIRSFTDMPSDFSRFWQKALKASAKIPLKPEVTFLPKYSNDSISVYLVRLNVNNNGRCIYGYMARPKAAGKYPVLFTPPGAGSRRIEPAMDYAKDGFISLNIEIHGFNPELPEEEYNRIRNTASAYFYRGIGDRDTYYYKNVYLACSRAVDFLCGLPEYDGQHAVVTGGSQGGALTIVTAALNPKVKCLAAFYPALSDVLGFRHQRAGGWPKFFASEKETARRLGTATVEQAEKTLQYYDVVNFARLLKVPGFYSLGYADNTCSPTSVWAVLNSITAPKKVVITPTSGHWRFPVTNRESIEWMKANW